MPRTKTCVLVVSEQDVVHAGLTTLLQTLPDVNVVPGRDPAIALQGVHLVLYDVVALAEGDGSDLDRLVKETDVAVVAVTHDLRPDLADRAIGQGVDGCVSGSATAAELHAMVKAAAWGDLHGDRSVDATDFTVNPATLGEGFQLTRREVDVLRLIAAGRTNQQIALELYVTINSVKSYVRTAYRRLGVTSRSQAVAWALQHGFAPPAEDAGSEPFGG